MYNLILILFSFFIIIPLFLYIINTKYFYYAVVIIYPIIGQSVNLKINILNFSLNPSMIFGLVVLGLGAFDFFLQSSKNPGLEIASILFIIYALVICIFSPIPFESFSWALKIATWLFLLLTASKIFNKEKEFHGICNATAIATFMLIISFALSKLGWYGRGQIYETGVKTYAAGFSSGKVFGYYLAIAIPILALKIIDKSFIGKTISLLLILLSLAVVILNFVRAPVIALLIGFLAYQYLKSRYGKRSYITAIVISLVLVFSLFFMFRIFQNTQYASRWLELSERYSKGQVEKLGSGRVGGLMNFYDYFLKKATIGQKFFGTGLGSSYALLGSRKFIHNDFAEILMGCGIIGFLIYMFILGNILRLMRTILKKVKNSDYSGYMILSISLFFVVLSFHMTNVTAGIFALAPWAIFTGATIGIGQNHLKEIESNTQS